MLISHSSKFLLRGLAYLPGGMTRFEERSQNFSVILTLFHQYTRYY
jgi:hypothetical protein